MLAACSAEPPANETALPVDIATTAAAPAPAPSASHAPTPTPTPPRFVGRWAANAGLCENGAWKFDADHLSTAGEVSCDFEKIAEMPGGYDVAARCLAEGASSSETIRLRFAPSTGTMLVESRTFQPISLIRCD